jgi:hypothetical protein
MRAGVRGCAANALLMAVTLVVSLGAGELIVRAVRPRPLEAASVWPDGTLRHLPSFHYTYTRPGFSNLVSYNAMGLRGSDIPANPDPGIPRVLFLGDSFVEGKQVADDQVLTAVLSDIAHEHGRPLDVINAGVAGYGTAEEILLWDQLGASLHPDAVLLGFYPNDVRNNADRHLFVLKDGAVTVGKKPRLPRVRWVYDLRKWMAARSHLYILITQGMELMDSPEAGESGPMEGEDVFLREPTARVTEGWALTLALLQELKTRVESTGSTFSIVMFPTRYQVDGTLWRKMLAQRGMTGEPYDLLTPQQHVVPWAAASGVTLLDLLPVFRDRNTGNSFYHTVDAHWNAAGHRLAAETIYEELSLPTFTRAGRSTVSPNR